MLTVTKEYRNGIFFIRLRGHLNKDTTYKFNKKVIDIIKDNGIRNIVFNFINLKSIDIKGINSIFYAYELCKNNKGRSLMCGNNKNINTKLKKSRLVNYVYEVNDEFTATKLLKG